MREENGRFASITTDHLGTPTEMYDEMGIPIWKAELDLFGVCTIERGTRAQCPFRWPGQYEDEETGLYYNRFRYYDPSEGAYVSQDPIRLASGLALYGYVADPLCEFDPFGLHQVRATLNGMPVVNPARGDNVWSNVPSSGAAPMASSGLGRLGDSENRSLSYAIGVVLDHLSQSSKRHDQDFVEEVLARCFVYAGGREAEFWTHWIDNCWIPAWKAIHLGQAERE